MSLADATMMDLAERHAETAAAALAQAGDCLMLAGRLDAAARMNDLAMQAHRLMAGLCADMEAAADVLHDAR